MAKRKKHRQKQSSGSKKATTGKRVASKGDQSKSAQASREVPVAGSGIGKRVCWVFLFVFVLVAASIYGTRAFSVHSEHYRFEGELAGKVPWTWETQLHYVLPGGGLVRAYQVRDGVLPEQVIPEIENLAIQVDGKEVRYDPEVKKALVGVDWRQQVKANAYGRETRFRLSKKGESKRVERAATGENPSFGVLRVKYGVVTRLDLDPPKGQVIPKVVRFSIPLAELKTVVAVFPEVQQGLAKGGAESK